MHHQEDAMIDSPKAAVRIDTNMFQQCESKTFTSGVCPSEVEPERSTSKGKSDLRVPAMRVFDLQPQDLSISTHLSNRHRHSHFITHRRLKITTPTKQNKKHKRHHHDKPIPRDDRQRETNLYRQLRERSPVKAGIA
jgi:hypothetical protein